MEPDQVVREFTHQSESFNVAPVMRSADTLGRLVDLIPAAPDAHWLDAACGPGLVARALAPRVGEVHGVDMTPAMVEVARREAAAEGIGNAVFSVGDATALDFADASFDGAVTRFSLHHIPVPGRVVTELARVVRPGGAVVVADHVTSADTPARPPGTRRSSACATRRTGPASRRPGCGRSASGPASCSSARTRRPSRSTTRSGSAAAAAGRDQPD
jgi:SAM-dependent methyltransferase